MEHPEERYYKLHRFLLSVIGLWPYQSEWSAYLMRTFITVVMLSSLFVQLVSIFMLDFTVDFIIQTIQGITSALGSVGHLYARVRRIGKFKELFNHMWSDWVLQKTNYEIKIMHEHAEITRLLSIHLLLLVYVNLVAYNIWLFVPQILDVISPMNESRPRTQPFDLECFIDKERYFYLIRFCICFVLFFLPLNFLINCLLLLTLSQHACGMCEILGFIGMIETCHTIPFLMDLIGLVLAIGVTLTQVLSPNGNIDIAFRSIAYCTVTLCYMFISNYMGQRITDMSSSVCDKVYNSIWYEAVASEQKLLLLIMKRRFHPLTLTAGKFYMMSLQNFGMILQTAISYCMFMRRF